jgi:hypothetical protein
MSSKTAASVESNPAVFHCCQAWRAAVSEARAKGEDEDSARAAAANAYRNAMPPLFGVRNTRNFIACVGYASLLGVINGPDCSRLLYAAQVAHSIRRIRSRKSKTQDAPVKKSRPDAIETGKKAVVEPFSDLGQAS